MYYIIFSRLQVKKWGESFVDSVLRNLEIEAYIVHPTRMILFPISSQERCHGRTCFSFCLWI